MPPAARQSLARLHTALLLAVLVLALGLLEHLPQAHAWLHAGHQGHTADSSCTDKPGSDNTHAPHAHDEGCAITVFAQGLPLADLAPRALPPETLREATLIAQIGLAIPPSPPARLHPPALAPPSLA